MAEARAVSADVGGHRRTLGFLWIVYGIYRLIAAIVLFVYINTATVMFGALLARVRDYETGMSVFHFLYGAVIVLSVICGIVGIMAGLAILSGGGRQLALWAGFLSVSDVPFGTTLGVYTLILYLP